MHPCTGRNSDSAAYGRARGGDRPHNHVVICGWTTHCLVVLCAGMCVSATAALAAAWLVFNQVDHALGASVLSMVLSLFSWYSAAIPSPFGKTCRTTLPKPCIGRDVVGDRAVGGRALLHHRPDRTRRLARDRRPTDRRTGHRCATRLGPPPPSLPLPLPVPLSLPLICS